MTAASARKIAWSVGLASIALMVAGLVFRFLDRSATLPLVSDAWSVGGAFEVVANLTLPVFGIVIVSRRRENLIGWIFLLAGSVLALGSFARSYALHALVADPGSLSAGQLSAWLSTWIEGIAIALLPWLFLLFPTGQLPSRRWRPIAWLSGALLVLLPGSFLVFATETWNRPFADLDVESGGSLLTVAQIGILASVLALVVAILASVGSVLVRFRRSEGEERLQLKWFVSAAAVVAVAFTVAIFVDNEATGLFFTFSLVLLDATIVVAMLKHRLYDIDVIIGKTVVYAILGAFITVVYVLVVVVVGAFIGATEGLAIIATAIVAVAAQPVRERARHAANRLVFGKRATPYEVLSEFSGSVAGAYAGEEIMPRMARLLAEGTGATAAKVWLRVDSEIRPTAVWPPEAGLGSARRLVNHELPEFAEVAAAVPVRHGGELLGALTVSKPPKESILPAEEQLIAELAAQAGLVLENFRLIEDLRSSRQRLVAAQDEERRRLERDLHDGAQQQLVALAVKVRLAETLVGREKEQREALQGIQQDAQEALENLRDLARGIYPPLLADQGLPPRSNPTRGRRRSPSHSRSRVKAGTPRRSRRRCTSSSSRPSRTSRSTRMHRT